MTVGAADATHEVATRLASAGLRVIERGWLSSNGIFFVDGVGPTTLVDTGYSAHADLTCALAERVLGSRPLQRIVNTHLHSDHCGGNAALQRQYPRCETLVPATTFHAVRNWDESSLTFARTDQRCERFQATGSLAAGDRLRLGAATWDVHAAPGHDPTALMLFEPQQRILISGDALWERRLAIVFPEMEGEEGFETNASVLDYIEKLSPAVVVPGHGRPFAQVHTAIAYSRERLRHYHRHPKDHTRHARRALLMYHMLEHQARQRGELRAWLREVPILQSQGRLSIDESEQIIDDLLRAGVLTQVEERISLV